MSGMRPASDVVCVGAARVRPGACGIETRPLVSADRLSRNMVEGARVFRVPAAMHKRYMPNNSETQHFGCN